MTQETHPPKLTMNQAADHYADGFRRGEILGAVREKDMLIKTLLSPGFHDQVDQLWQGDTTIYEAIVKVIENKG